MKKLTAGLILTAILTLTYLVACESRVKTSKEAQTRITYFKDNRTGLCFAQITSATYGNWEVVSVATVPCDKVEKFLIK